MNPIDFLLLHDDPQAGQWLAGLLTPNVSIEVIPWREGWSITTRAAIYKKGPDLTVVGGTAAADFAGMEALRPFTRNEVDLLGGAKAFLPIAWRMAYQDDPSEIWSIPWFCGTYVIYYWRDMLEEAGLDETTAFDTPEHLEKTLDHLQVRGQSGPWSVPTRYSLASLHCLASWIWGLGGDFISRDGKQLLFDHPEALEAFKRYFHLFRYIHPASRASKQDARQLLAKREVAVSIGSSGWLGEIERQKNADTGHLSKLGVALPPGLAYIGSNNLVIFQYSRYPEDAFKVIQTLVDRKVQQLMSENPLFGQLPVLAELLTKPPFTTNPHYQVLNQALQTGRTYPFVRMWGMVETRLSELLSRVEAVVLADPETDLETLIPPMVKAIADRLRTILDLE